MIKIYISNEWIDENIYADTNFVLRLEHNGKICCEIFNFKHDPETLLWRIFLRRIKNVTSLKDLVRSGMAQNLEEAKIKVEKTLNKYDVFMLSNKFLNLK